jgi:hypothetical protein
MQVKSLPDLSIEARNLRKGVYEHYKGHRYLVLGVARHSEDLEEYVVYQSISDPQAIWIRPLQLFCEEIMISDGVRQPRFQFVSE